jgi:crossover junction endodeoxyribonuclease RuvC
MDEAPRVLDFGLVETSPRAPMHIRLHDLYVGLAAVIRRTQPGVLAIEQLFFARNVTTALSVGQARGVVLLLAAECGLDVYEYKPNEVKLAVAGYGGASKQQMQEMVRVQLELAEPPHPDDAADALAVALCHVFSRRFAEVVEQSAQL